MSEDEYNLTFEQGTIGQETERFEIEWNEKKAWFEKKELSHNELYQIADEALEIEDGELDINFAELQKEIRREQIVDSSVENHNAFLTGVKPELGVKINKHLTSPKKVLEIVNEETGN